MVKPVEFRGSSLDDLRAFPKDAAAEAGHQIYRVQCGKGPANWRTMKDVGPGVQEKDQ